MNGSGMSAIFTLLILIGGVWAWWWISSRLIGSRGLIGGRACVAWLGCLVNPILAWFVLVLIPRKE